jgi:hypothetical protein
MLIFSSGSEVVNLALEQTYINVRSIQRKIGSKLTHSRSMPSITAWIFLALASILSVNTVKADWQFKSRPDLAPPKLNITIPATPAISPGYLFIAPFSGYPEGTHHGPLQAAPYIFTSTGGLVWSGFTYFSIWATNFQAAKYKGKDILFSFEGSHNATYGHRHGHTTILDQNYEAIRKLRAGNHRLTDKHEFHIIDEETALIQIYHPVPWDLKAYGGSGKQQWIVDARFQELDIESGKVLFEWSSLDHADPEGKLLRVSELVITASKVLSRSISTS